MNGKKEDFNDWQVKTARASEQMEASAETIARLLSVFYHEAIKTGFSEDAALQLTRDYQAELFALSRAQLGGAS